MALAPTVRHGNLGSESAADRPMPLRVRPDLVILPQFHGRDRYWLVKDPAALRYYHLRDEEHALLRMLDGQASLSAVKRLFEAEFAPLRVSMAQLHGFIGHLHEMGLLLVDAPGQGRHLSEQHLRHRMRRGVHTLTNVLALRLPGFDPQRLLAWVYPKCRWMFSPWFLGLVMATIVAAILLVVRDFVVLGARLPDFRAFLTPGNLVCLAAVLAVVKILHELAHALTCKHLGGDCHEIGVLLLIFTPCLYCDVSDVWLFPNRWRRVAVSAAGIVIELFLAALATFLWYSSAPGPLNTLCLNIMFVCSLSTLIFNGNPLLRYDGYYVLTDLVEVPNLGQQSRGLLGRTLASFFFGSDLPPVRTVARNRRGFLLLYGAASVLYGWVVLIGVLWFCYHAMEPRGMKVVAQLLTCVVLAGAVAMPAGRAVATIADPMRRPRVRTVRSLVSICLFVALLLGMLLIPLPFSVHAPATIELRDAEHVYVLVPGRVESSVLPGVAVTAGQEVLKLANIELRKEIADLTGSVEQQRTHLASLRTRLARDPSVSAQIPAATAALTDTEARLRQRKVDEKRLTIRSPATGTVIPSPRRRPDRLSSGQLQVWQGSPLDPRNRGCHLETGTVVCQIGTPGEFDVILVIDQADVNFVHQGQLARIVFPQKPGKILNGTILEIAKTDLKIVPRELATGSDLLVCKDEKGVPRPQTTSYQARVRLDHSDDSLRVGARGRGKIVVDPRAIGRRIRDYIAQTFGGG
jgi:putative peptide zinc metalloprotease protein